VDTLVFQLQASLAAWGGPAVGESRGTAEFASQSALVGLLAAALGCQRNDEAAHAGLRDGLAFAVGVLAQGSLLRDYHTAQVPKRTALKGMPHATRRHELAVDKTELSTTLSSRDYRQNASCLVALRSRSVSAPALDALAAALRMPRFMLYLGRKSCPPAAPLWPQRIEADSAYAAFVEYVRRFDAARGALLEPLPKLRQIAFADDMPAGQPVSITTVRKDRLIRRRGWQFGDRTEHVAIVSDEA
jgi:CRISPR system Cascade subunit CasD